MDDAVLRREPTAEEADGLEAAIQKTIAEIKQARTQMQSDQAQIDSLKAEIKNLRQETRVLLDTLNAAV